MCFGSTFVQVVNIFLNAEFININCIFVLSLNERWEIFSSNFRKGFMIISKNEIPKKAAASLRSVFARSISKNIFFLMIIQVSYSLTETAMIEMRWEILLLIYMV